MSSQSAPPRGLGWTDNPTGRGIVTLLSIFTLLLTLFVGYQYVELVDCLNDHAIAAAVRTKKLSDATDAERTADRLLLAGAPTREDREQLRLNALRARENTDAVRRANPPPPEEPCG